MSDKAAESTVTDSIANGGVTPEMKQEFQKVVMGIVPDLIKRSIKQSLTETIPSLLKEMTAAGAATAKDTDSDKPSEGERSNKNMKALETQLAELREQLKSEKEATEKERSRSIDQQMRGEVRDALTGIFGADNPHLSLVMDSLYDARKRFVKGEDGQTLVRFKPEYGTDDELLPLGSKDTVKRLSGELKHLMPAKTEKLPAARRGTALPQGQPGGNNVLDSIFSNVASQAAATVDPTQK